MTDRATWVAGLYYLQIRTDFIQGLAESAAGADDFALRGTEANTITELDTDSTSLFGQVDWRLSDTLTLVTGLRLVQEDKDFEGTVDFFPNNNDRKIETDGFLFSIEQFADDNDQTLWSGKVQLEWSPDDASLYYAGVNRGVKAGSFNAPLFGGFSPYDEEVLWAYEVGAKLTLMDGLAQLNASAYLYDYNDYQSFSFRNNSSQVTNEEATYKGFEVELFANPTEGLDLALGLSYTDAEVEGLLIAPGIERDTVPPFTPEWQFSGLARYTWDNVMGGALSAQVNGTWKSEFYFAAPNYTAHEFDDASQVDARITWQQANGHWTVVGFVENLTDERDSIIGFDVSAFYGTSQESYTRPRAYGLQVRYSL